METNSWFYFLACEAQLIHIQFKHYFIIFPSMGLRDFEHIVSVLLCILHTIPDQAYECGWIFILTSRFVLKVAWLTECLNCPLHTFTSYPSPCKALPHNQIFIRISWLSYVLNTNKVLTGGYPCLCHVLYCGMPRKTLSFQISGHWIASCSDRAA